MAVKKGTKGKSYNLTPEAAKAMDDLNDKIDNMGKSEIASEAIIQFALAKGVRIRGRKKKPKPERMVKKINNLEKTVEALCNIALYDTADFDEGDIEKVNALIQKAVNAGTDRTTDALWGKLEMKIPKKMRDKDYFTAIVQVEGIPEQD